MKTPILNTLVDRMIEQVEIIALRGELEAFIAECDALTTTNCGWQPFHVAKITKDYAKYLLAIQQAGKVRP